MGTAPVRQQAHSRVMPSRSATATTAWRDPGSSGGSAVAISASIRWSSVA